MAKKSDVPLWASNKKIERAKRKFSNLQRHFSFYCSQQPYGIRTETHGTCLYIIAHLGKELPEDFTFEAVELIGHLRSALDKMVVDLVNFNGRGVSGVGFPFGGMNEGKPEPFPTKRMSENIKKKLTPEQWEFITSKKPYPGGDDTLWAINEIANADKHREGLVELKPILRHQLGVKGDSSGRLAIRRMGYLVPEDQAILADQERETVLMSLDTGGTEFKVDCQIGAGIIFGEIVPVQGKEVLPTLAAQIELAAAIIGECRTQFFGDG